MTKIKLTLIMLPILALLSFNKANVTYQTECVSLETNGYVTFKIWDTKKGDKYKPEQAMKDAVNAILYSGISGSNGCLTQPPILNKLEEQEKFKSIEKSFFANNGKWSIYTRNSSPETIISKSIGTKNWKVYQVSVSKNELRKYLEQQKIINSLNSGF